MRLDDLLALVEPDTQTLLLRALEWCEKAIAEEILRYAASFILHPEEGGLFLSNLYRHRLFSGGGLNGVQHQVERHFPEFVPVHLGNNRSAGHQKITSFDQQGGFMGKLQKINRSSLQRYLLRKVL